MSEDETRGPRATRLAKFDGRMFVRLGLWSLAAGIAVTVALYVGSSEPGLRRITESFASIRGVPPAPPREVALRDNSETQRLSESLRQINADRNRMIERLESIERHLDDLTGSINRGTQPTGLRPDENPQPVMSPVAALPAGTTAGSQPSTPAQQPPDSAQEAAPSDTPATGKIEFGIDLGSAQTIDGLRLLWTSAKGKHGTLLDNLRPIVTIRENSRPGAMELRLVAGPLVSAATAARMCATITAAGAVCQPAVFDGQRLALR